MSSVRHPLADILSRELRRVLLHFANASFVFNVRRGPWIIASIGVDEKKWRSGGADESLFDVFSSE